MNGSFNAECAVIMYLNSIPYIIHAFITVYVIGEQPCGRSSHCIRENHFVQIGKLKVQNEK